MRSIQNDKRVEAIGDQLRAKLNSKFTASTFLAGFALTIISGQVFTLWQSSVLPVLFPPAVGFVAAAVFLFVDAVRRLDQLTLPKRFWEESKKAGDTGHSSREGYLLDDDLWELRKHMIFYWTRLTLVATSITGIAVLLMLVPLRPLPTECLRLAAFVCAFLGLGIAFAYDYIIMKAAWSVKDETKRLKQLIRQPD